MARRAPTLSSDMSAAASKPVRAKKPMTIAPTTAPQMAEPCTPLVLNSETVWLAGLARAAMATMRAITSVETISQKTATLLTRAKSLTPTRFTRVSTTTVAIAISSRSRLLSDQPKMTPMKGATST